MGQNQSPATSRRSSRTSPARRSATLKMRPRSSRSPVPSQRRGHTLLLGAEDEQEHNGDHDQGQKQREGNTKARNSSSSNYNNKSNSNSSSSQNDAGSGSRIGNNRVKSSSSSSSSSSSNDNIIAISNTNDNETDRGDYKKNRAPKTGNVGGADGDNDDDDDDDDDDDFENTSSEEDEKTIRQTRLTRSARKTRASASMGKSAPTTPLTRRQKQQLQKSDETTNTNVDNNEESSEDDDEDEDEDGREVMHNSTPGRLGKRAKTSKLIDPPIRNGRVSTRSVTNTPNTSQTKQIGRTKSTRQSIVHNDKGFRTLIDEDEKDDQRKASLRGRSGKQQAKIVQLRTRSTSRRDSRNDITVLDPEASSQYSSSESSGDNVSNNDVQVVRQNRRRSERRVHREGKEASAPLRTTRSSARKMQTRKDKVSKRTKVKSASSVAASQSLSSSASEEEVENSTKLTKKSVSRKTPIRRTRGNSKVSSSKSSTPKRKRRRREVDIINEESNLLQQRTNDKSESSGSSSDSDSDSDNSSGSDSGEEGISQDRKRGKTKIEARTTRASARKHGQPFVTETESAHLGFPVKLEIDASTPEDFTNGTVFFYGDSITWGMAHNYTGRYMKTWPRLLSERLQQYKLDVVESALCSRTTAFDDDGNEEWMNGARPHDFNGLDHFVPEFVSACPKWLVVLLGTNDLRTCIRRRAKGRTRLDARHIAQSCARIPMKAREIQENNPFFSRGLKIIVICPPRVNLNALARELGYDESSAHIAQDFSKAYKEMCAEHGLLYAEANIDMSHSVDGIHVTEDANVLVADAVWSIFRQELGPPPEGVEAALSSAPLVTAPPNPLMEEDLKGKKRRRISTTGKQRSGESTEKDDEVKSAPSIRINSKQQNGRNNQKNKSSTTSKKGANITLDSESERDDGALDDDSSSAESGEEEDADEDHLTLSDLARLRQRNSDANEAKIDTSSSSNADSDEEENSSSASKSKKPKRPLGSREHPTHMKRARKESSDQNSEDSDEENESGSDEEVDIEEEESSADENDDEDGDDESVEKEGRKYTKNRIEENDEDQDEEEDEDEDEEEDEDEDEEEDEGEEEDEDEDKEEEEDEDEVEEEDDEEEEISIHELQRRLHEEHVQQQQQLQMQQELQKRQLRHQQLQQEAYLRQLQHEQQLACQATSSSSSSMFNSANRPRLSSASSSYPDDPSMEDLETSFQSNESFYIVGVSRQDTARRISEEVALVDVFSRITGQLSTEDMEDIIDCILDIQNNPFYETKPRLGDILEKVSECAGSQLAYELAEIIGFST